MGTENLAQEGAGAGWRQKIAQALVALARRIGGNTSLTADNAQRVPVQLAAEKVAVDAAGTSSEAADVMPPDRPAAEPPLAPVLPLKFPEQKVAASIDADPPPAAPATPTLGLSPDSSRGLSRGGPARLPVASQPPVDIGEGGRVAYDPINVNATYHNGHIYYPIETLVQEHIGDSKEGPVIQEHTEVVVVRSDRTVHRAHASKAPEGSSREKVYRLSDGTLINRPPMANPHGTWQFDAVARYLDGYGDEIALAPLLRAIHQHLYSRVWLPNEDDYWLLTFVVATSYVQSIFDAVPLCLVCGPAGSGKSEIGAAAAQVAANAVMIGQTSPATMMRLIDESGGLVVIDDLEAIGARGQGNKKERFSEIAQVLKVSYKKSTATKVITDAATMKTRTLNFFGVKILNNTTGTSGATLGSRMVKVHTQYLPPEEKAAFLARPKISESELAELRNLMHVWAMSHVQQVRSAYLETIVNKSLREEEIAAPLRTLARLASDKNAAAALERALEKDELENLDPVELLGRTVESLARQGYRAVSLQHVLLMLREARVHVEDSCVEAPWLKLEWIGKQLRQMKVTTDDAIRKRLHGVHLRIVTLAPEYLADLVRRYGQLPAARDPFDFCGQCDKCRFARVDCEISVKRNMKLIARRA